MLEERELPEMLRNTSVYVADKEEYALAMRLYKDFGGASIWPWHKGWSPDEDGKMRMLSCNEAGVMLEIHAVPGGNELISLGELTRRCLSLRRRTEALNYTSCFIDRDIALALARVHMETWFGDKEAIFRFFNPETGHDFDVITSMETCWRMDPCMPGKSIPKERRQLKLHCRDTNVVYGHVSIDDLADMLQVKTLTWDCVQEDSE